MTTVLAPEYKIIAKAQRFAKGELPPENQRSSKLLSRIYKEPDAWLETYSRFKDLSWASEVFLLGLNTAEQESLKSLLETTGIFGIKLTSIEGYKALAVSGVREHLKKTHEALRSLKQELEGELKAVIRHDKNGIVVSGYKRGWPFTTYIGPTEFFHKVYVDKLGRFETIDRAIQSRLPQMDELRVALVKVERRMAEIRKTWECWKAEESVKMRLENLEKFSDTGGALS